MADLEEWAEEKPLFNLNEVQRVTGHGRNYLRQKLSRKVEAGVLQRIERGKYTIHQDPMIYCSHIERPSYISLWSGLRFYDLTPQQPTHMQVICASNRDDLEGIEFYYSKNIFGFSRKRYRDFDIFVADKEKLLLDALSYAHIPVDELKELVKNIDIDKTVQMASKMDINSVSKRTGYLIDKIRDERIDDLKIRDRNYPILDLTKPEDGERDQEWRLQVNTNAY